MRDSVVICQKSRDGKKRKKELNTKRTEKARIASLDSRKNHKQQPTSDMSTSQHGSIAQQTITSNDGHPLHISPFYGPNLPQQNPVASVVEEQEEEIVEPEIYDACHDVAGPSNARGSMLDLSNMQHEELIEVAEALLEENIELNSENKACSIQQTQFYSTNKWTEFFNDESLHQQDFDFSNESGQYKVYLVRDGGVERFNLKYIGITTEIKTRMIKHRNTKIFIELKNPEYAVLLENLTEKTALFMEGLLILSSQLGYNLLNRRYEFTNITKGLSDYKEIAELSRDDLKNIIIEYHKKAINILKKRWNIVEWIKF
uniref:Uncharacterized protein n=1 Tax=Meloidogyne incognita TaxID=6306 RepID=A0A914LFQ8_MELIC